MYLHILRLYEQLVQRPQISLHSDKEKCSKWLEHFQIRQDELKPHMRVHSGHFLARDASKLHNLARLGTVQLICQGLDPSFKKQGH